MAKLSDITSKRNHIWEFCGERLPVSAFNARVMRDMEKDGIDMNEFFVKLKTQPTTTSVTLLWYLLSSEAKDFFDNSLEALFEALGPNDLEIVTVLMETIYEDSQPTGKKLETDEKRPKMPV